MRQTLIALVGVALVVVLAVGAGVALYMATRDSQRLAGSRADSSPITASPAPDASDAGESTDAVDSPESGDDEGGDDAGDEEEAHPVRFYGTVTVAATGAPIAGATILDPDGGFQPEDDEESSEEESTIMTGIKAVVEAFSEDTLEVQTDESGAYELTVSSEGSTLLCSAQGFASAQFDFYDPELTEKRLDFRLVPEATLSGRVVDEQGKGVGGVLIYMEDVRRTYEDVPGFGWGGAYEELASEEDGSFSVVGLPPGNYRLSVDANEEGYLTDSRRDLILNVREGEHLAGVDIELTRGGTVTGTVRDMKGNPVFEASVSALVELGPTTALPPNYSDNAYASSEEDGTFQVRPVRLDREFRLVVKHEDYAREITEPMRLSAAEPSTSVDLALDSGSQVSGIAVNAEGKPVADAYLNLFGNEIGFSIAEPYGYWTSCEEDGSFTFEHVAQGSYRLSGGKTPISLEVRAREDISDLRVVVDDTMEEPLPELEGVVLGSDGEPRADVDVMLMYSPTGAAVDGATTEEDGTFVFTDLTASLDEMANLQIADPAAQALEGTFELHATSEEGIAKQGNVSRGDNVTLRLQPAATVAGTVVDSQGQPVPYCTVTLLPVERGPERSPLSVSAMQVLFSDYYFDLYSQEEIPQDADEVGHFEFTQVDNGTYSVVAVSKLQGAGESQTFTVAQAAGPGNLRITLERPMSFSGMVTGPDGRPLPGATVELYRSTRGIESVEAVADVFWQDANGAAMSGANGTFEIDGLPHGLYSVRATHPDYAPCVQHDVELARRRDVSGHVISLTTGGGLRGVVTGPGDVPLRSRVYLYGQLATADTETNAQGQFEIARLPAGTYTLSNSPMEAFYGAMEEEPDYHSVTIVDRQVTEIAIHLGTGVDVAGAVSGQLPEGQVWVCLLKEEGGQDSAALDEDRISFLALSNCLVRATADGSFEFKRIEPGTYTVRVAVTETGLNLGMAEGVAALAEALAEPLHTQEVILGTEAITLDIAIP